MRGAWQKILKAARIKARKRDRKYAKPALQSPPEVVPEDTSTQSLILLLWLMLPMWLFPTFLCLIRPLPLPLLPLPPSPPLLIVLPLPTLHRSHRLRFPSLSLYVEILNESGLSLEFSSFFSELF
jgi:hypothetical protein